MGYLNDRLDEAANRLKTGWNDLEGEILEVVGNANVSGLIGLAREMSPENIRNSLNISIHGNIEMLNCVFQGLLEYDYSRLDIALGSLSKTEFLNSVNSLNEANLVGLFSGANRINYAVVDRIIKESMKDLVHKWCESVSSRSLGEILVTYPPQPDWLTEFISSTMNKPDAQKRLSGAVLSSYNSIGIPCPEVLTNSFVNIGPQAREKILSNIGTDNTIKMLSQFSKLDPNGKTIVAGVLSNFHGNKIDILAGTLNAVFNSSIPDFEHLVKSLFNYERIGKVILHLPEDVQDIFVQAISGVDLGKVLGTLSPPYMEGPMSKICVRGGTFDPDCFIRKSSEIFPSLSDVVGDLEAQFTTPGHVTLNLFTGAYDIDVKLGLGELFLARHENNVPSCDVGDWFEFCSSLHEVTIEVNDYDYYRKREEWYQNANYYSHFSSKRWVNYFSVSEAASATAWAIISQGASVDETIERTTKLIYLELEDILVWLTSFDGPASLDYVFPQLVQAFASGAMGGQMQHYAFRPSGVNYYHQFRKPLNNLIHAILQNWPTDRVFDTWEIADRHCSYSMQSGIPLPDDRTAVNKQALQRILSAYQSGENNTRELVGDYFYRHDSLERDIPKWIADRIGVPVPSQILRFMDYRDQMEDVRELQSIISPDSLAESDIQSIYDSYDGLSPIIDLSHSFLTGMLESKLDFLAMGNKGEASVQRLELNVLTASLSAEVDIIHKYRFN